MVPTVSGAEDTRYFNFYQENNINIAESVREEDLKLFKEFWLLRLDYQKIFIFIARLILNIFYLNK